MSSLGNLPYALMMTFSPQRGGGWTEAVLAILFSLTFCLLMTFQREIPEFFIGLMGILIGFYFGNQNQKYQKN